MLYHTCQQITQALRPIRYLCHGGSLSKIRVVIHNPQDVEVAPKIHKIFQKNTATLDWKYCGFVKIWQLSELGVTKVRNECGKISGNEDVLFLILLPRHFLKLNTSRVIQFYINKLISSCNHSYRYRYMYVHVYVLMILPVWLIETIFICTLLCIFTYLRR